ncbi:hypothetical protein OOT33_07665 [Sphingobium sp. DEHP117]|uniref:hypothetical protein n=1 Tax=Sphingobium sp. DEHP117 TaxID=2993436 RepID=UPI0027D75BDA|nr:hypothetical protein [Sphingobium sp. DEHP117]MDQ4420310.1 hypothetical protein [Sphingobium sp. DEHP117]
MNILPLAEMDQRHPGLTEGMAQMFFEAASVCFARHHSRPSVVDIETVDGSSQATVDWLAPTPQMDRAYANTIDTTEWGAYGVSLAALELQTGYVAVQRAETLSGADFYVAPATAANDDLETALRLEVSGTDQGARSVCRTRLTKKIDQTRAAGHSKPALASVVGFSEKLVLVSQVIEP